MSCTLWMIWKNRNVYIYQGQELNPLATVIQTSNIIRDYSCLISSDQSLSSDPRRQTHHRNWRPHLQGITKINSDTTFSKLTGFSFAGIIARNHDGSVATGVTSKNRANSVLMAESLALRDAVSLARNLDLERVVFESDSLDLIKACRGELKKHQIQNILKDIWQMKQDFLTCGFTWTPREGNEVAHTIAQMASSGSLPINWTWNCPRHLRLLIDKDRSNISTTLS